MAPALLAPTEVAGLLYAHGYVPATLPADDAGLALVLVRLCEAVGRRAGALPAHARDFAAVRRALAEMTRAAERAGRSRECARYHPDSTRRCRAAAE